MATGHLAALLIGTIGFGLATDVAAADGRAHRWSGCYAGINSGLIANASSITTTPAGVYTTALTASQFAALTNTESLKDSDATLGGQVGCNRQRGNWLYGVEGDFNWAGLNESMQGISVSTGALPTNQSISQVMDWFSTVRGRLGFAWDRWLVYATGGVAFGHVKSSLTVTFPGFPNSPLVGDQDVIRVGWAGGAGAEYALSGHWSAKVEYLYVDLGSSTYLAVPVPDDASGGAWSAEVDTQFHVVRFGLNYMFWSGGAGGVDR